MKTFKIYHRDDSGIIKYCGPEEWGSLADMLQYYCRDNRHPETEALQGWPHRGVTWYGDLGVAQ